MGEGEGGGGVGRVGGISDSRASVMKEGDGCIDSWWVSDDLTHAYERFTRKPSLWLRSNNHYEWSQPSYIRSRKERDARTGGRYCMGEKLLIHISHA